MPRHKPRRIGLDVRGLIGMNDLFRLSGGVRRDPAVDAWFSDGPADLRSIAHTWFVRMRQCGDDVRELMHDGCPVACVEDAAFAYVNSFKSHVNVGFFYGALLEDPRGLLEGSGKRMRHVKLGPGRERDDAALGDLVDAAYADIKLRLRTERRAQER
jgi:hypothetical protein